MKKVLKICLSSWEHASRDERELSVVQKLGADVEVVAKGAVTGEKDVVDGFNVTRISTRPLGTHFPVSLNRIVSVFTWAAYIRRLKPDIISGHDLVALLIGYLSNLGAAHKAQLVYDSHEFELGRAGVRSRFETWCIAKLERFLMNRCAFSIMVNDSIADEVQRIHRLKDRPVVARNVPSYWELDPAETARVRSAFFKTLELPENTFFVMYHGAVVQDRGIENLLRAVEQVSGTAAVILGDSSDPSYLTSLQELCENLKISKRVLFHPAVPLYKLRNYVSAVDAGTDLGTSACKSYYFSLSNKFFETIQSMTPLIVGDCPEMGKIMRKYDIGVLVDPECIEDIAAAIERLRTDKEFYASCKKNLKRAKCDLCWEKEKNALQVAYQKIL